MIIHISKTADATKCWSIGFLRLHRCDTQSHCRHSRHQRHVAPGCGTPEVVLVQLKVPYQQLALERREKSGKVVQFGNN